MFLDIMNIKVFHIAEPSRVEHNLDSDYFATAHPRLSVRFVAYKVLLDRFFEFQTEFINKTENFSNFIVRIRPCVLCVYI